MKLKMFFWAAAAPAFAATILSAQTITTQPTNQTVMAGSMTKLSVAVSGDGPFTCQWQFNGTNLPNGIITTVAGNGSGGYSGDGGPATNASLYYPEGAAFDAAGNLFIADFVNNRIRKVTTNGIITTVAGNGSTGYSGDGVAATNATIRPAGVALDASGNLFIADWNNNRVRKVDTNGIITTVAGNGSPGYSGDGGPATSASLAYVEAVDVDGSGNLFIADTDNNRIRKVDTNGIITTVAGKGPAVYGSYSGDGGPATNASLNAPYGVAVDATGNLFIADMDNNRIRKVDTNGIITTVAGNGSLDYSGDGGLATNACLDAPYGVAVDAFGNLFFADSSNDRIRKVDSFGIITTVAGNDNWGYSGDGGMATNATLNLPSGVALDSTGNLFLADLGNERVREVVLFASNPTLTLNNVGPYNEGNYSIVITGPDGSVTSSNVTLTVLSPPIIVSQPQSLAVLGGAPASFGVSVVGTTPFHFQWQKNGVNLTDDGNLSGSATNNLFVTAAATNDAGGYTVIITNVWGSVTSSAASLVVMMPAEPADQTVMAGGTATFTVAVAGAGPFTFQWQLNGTNLPDGIITTVAGNGTNAFSGDGGPATNASVHPFSVFLDISGNLFITGSSNRIRKVSVNGVITTVAGNGTNSYSGDGGPATNASLSSSGSTVTDPSGNLFIADYNNNRIRKVDTNGIITTVAGNGTNSYSGDGGPATNASLNHPYGITFDNLGNLYIADFLNNRVRKMDTNGMINTVAGNGTGSYSGDGGTATNASLNHPFGVALDAFGNLFISDSLNFRVRKVDINGIITTVAGNGINGYSGDGGAATNAKLYFPYGVALDASGNLFIADDINSRIRKVSIDGMITTVAGNGSSGYSSDGGAATNTSLYQPLGVAVDTFGNLFIADTSNNRVRKVALFASYPTLALNNVTARDAGNYSVIITTPYGSFTSSIVTLTVASSPPIIVSQPQNLAVRYGTPASFGVSVIGTVPFHFQWQKNGANLADDGNLSGSTTTNLLLNATATNDVGDYTVIITNMWGSVTSSVAHLRGELVSVEPANQLVMMGGKATFNVEIFDTGPFTYQWQLNGTNLPYGMTTVAGNGSPGFSGDDGPATNAMLNSPLGMAWDAFGNLFIADASNNRIRKLSVNGIITTVAGNGINGFSGDGGAATNASLNAPYGVTVDANGNLFIGDYANNRIRKINTNGMITTMAGNGSGGYFGDGGPATNAGLHGPFGVALDAFGNLFIGDYFNNCIRKVDSSGIITSVAGNGTGGYSGNGGAATNAILHNPENLVFDISGNLFFADTGNNCIRKVDVNGIITAVAGNGTRGYSGDGGAATNAMLNLPTGVVLDPFGNLFIADWLNNCIRKVDTNGVITTVAGNGAITNASFNLTGGVETDASGNLLIADTLNNRICKVSLFASYPTLTLNNITMNNSGNYSVIVTGPYGSFTSSLVTLSVATAPLISKSVFNPDGSVTLNLLTAPNIGSRVFAATNLTPPVIWQPICTNVAGPAGAWQFTDTNAGSHPVQFYRSATP